MAVGAYAGPVVNGSSQRPGPTSWGDGGSCPGGGWCLWCECGGRQFPTFRAHQLGGRGVMPRRRSVPMEGLRGPALPNGPGLTSWGDGESYPGVGRCLWRACGGGLLPTAHAHQLGGWGIAEAAHGTHGGLAGSASSQQPEALSRRDEERAEAVIGVYGEPARDGCSQRRGPTS